MYIIKTAKYIVHSIIKAVFLWTGSRLKSTCNTNVRYDKYSLIIQPTLVIIFSIDKYT